MEKPQKRSFGKWVREGLPDNPWVLFSFIVAIPSSQCCWCFAMCSQIFATPCCSLLSHFTGRVCPHASDATLQNTHFLNTCGC